MARGIFAEITVVSTSAHTQRNYRMPSIDDALDSFHEAEYFSSIHLRSRHWQITIDEADREKTTTVTSDGLFEFKVPFGVCNDPADFKKMIDCLLQDLKWKTCVCYLDDIIVSSATFSSHPQRLADYLDVFHHAVLQLNSSKCRYGSRMVNMLGYLVGKRRIINGRRTSTQFRASWPRARQCMLEAYLGNAHTFLDLHRDLPTLCFLPFTF